MERASHGYDGSVGYSYGFYREMAPSWLDLCALAAGQAPPRSDEGAPFRYLELGAGQGFGLCLLAAANPAGEFVGVDFHPDHIAHAQGLAAAAGLTNLRFYAADFVALAADWPADFGTFDYVALHGVYSWVPSEVRAAVVRCLAHATHAGSLVYASYNAQPGWLGTMPFQHISRLIKETSGAAGEAVFAQSIGLFDRLRAGGAATFQILPGLKARLDSVKTRSLGYLVQEYLHESWNPLWHSQVAGELAGAGLGYAGSATLAETMLPDALPPPLRAAVAEQADPRLRQDVQDFVVNQSFRRDLFVRGGAGPGARDLAAIGRVRLVLLDRPKAGGTITLETAFGEIGLQYPAFAQVVEALAAGPKAIAELADLPDMRRQGMANAVQILLLLLHAGTLAVAGASARSEGAARLNAAIARGAGEGLAYGHIAAPAIGSAVAASEADLLLLDAWLAPTDAPRQDNAAFRELTLPHTGGRSGRSTKPGLA